MKLDWSQIDLLLPYLTYLEELHLCRNFCCTISSKYTLPKGVFNDLKYLNLEENRITDWDELSEFRKLKSLTRLGLGINQIKSVTHRPGFRELTSLDLYDNFIDSWDIEMIFACINQINEYSEIRKLRITNNPLSNQDTKEKIRQNMIARARYLELYNGSQVSKVERKDCEVFYVKKCYMEYLQANGGQEAAKVDKIDDPRLADFMNKHHPRWYELIEIHGSPIELVNSQKLSHQENIKSSSVNVVLISKFSGSEGKTFKKKLLPSMTVCY